MQAKHTPAFAIFPRLLTKKATIMILPCDQKLTEEKICWDCTLKFGKTSTAQYKMKTSK